MLYYGGVILFHGVTKIESGILIKYFNRLNWNLINLIFFTKLKEILFLYYKVDQINNYSWVMEYADGGALRNYLKKNFENLTRNDKYNLAYQLARSVLYIHNAGIAYRDLAFL